ncbi:MAG TPA: hypothetical protein VM597_12135 [Gemmataceae bacterium]|nr:hypothetical protein [Gemmataceae bacterium]
MSPQTRTGLIAAAIVGGVFLVCGGAVALLVAKRSPGAAPSLFGPSESWAGKDWTHKDLAAHLRAKGLRFTMSESERPGSLVAWFDFKEMRLVEVWEWATVTVTKADTPEVARDQGGLAEDRMSWGRFWFRGPKVFLDLIRKALG